MQLIMAKRTTSWARKSKKERSNLRMRRKKVIEKVKQEPSTIREINSLTFKPRICKKSEMIASQMSEVGRSHGSEDLLSRKRRLKIDCSARRRKLTTRSSTRNNKKRCRLLLNALSTLKSISCKLFSHQLCRNRAVKEFEAQCDVKQVRRPLPGSLETTRNRRETQGRLL